MHTHMHPRCLGYTGMQIEIEIDVLSNQLWEPCLGSVECCL